MLLGYFSTPRWKQYYSRIFRALVSRSNLFFKQNKFRRNTNQCSILIRKKQASCSLCKAFSTCLFFICPLRIMPLLLIVYNIFRDREYLIFFWIFHPAWEAVHTANKLKDVVLTFNVFSALHTLSGIRKNYYFKLIIFSSINERIQIWKRYFKLTLALNLNR